jgi:hypothetical protein
MILGATAISFAEAPDSEQASWKQAMERECDRYGLRVDRVEASLRGEDPLAREKSSRRWWEALVVAGAVAIFAWLASGAQRQPIAMNVGWMAALIVATLVFLVVAGVLLWKRTRFS